MEQTNNENIVNALKLLDHAAKQKKNELRTVMSDKYEHLKDLIVEDGAGVMQSWTASKDRAIQGAVNFKDAGIEKAREIAGGVDRNVHGNAWYYIAGTAGAGILLGYILGRNHRGARK